MVPEGPWPHRHKGWPAKGLNRCPAAAVRRQNAPMPDTPAPWPYPLWIAHRGAGRLAPENTLAAFRMGVAHGYRMLECDVRLSADGVPFLLHDDDLDRTTSGHGPSGDRTWAELCRLDAGRWHSPAFAGERLPTLADAAAFSLAQPGGHWINLELKPSPGTEELTGRVVAREVLRLWDERPRQLPLLTSFRPVALAGARSAAPGLPRGLLIDRLPDDRSDQDWLSLAADLGCCAVVLQHRLWQAERVALAREAGLRCLTYTVNEADEVQRLQDLGLDGLITDRVDLFDPGR